MPYQASRIGRGPKCPAFKSRDTVLQRPNDEPASDATVAPGYHAVAAEGGFGVVWWDPSALDLKADPPLGLRRAELVMRDVPKNVIADGRSDYDRWRLARADARARGSEASLTVATVRELTDPERRAKRDERGEALPLAPGGGIEVSVIDTRVEQAGAALPALDVGGTAFGTLVHAILAVAPFDASLERLEAIAESEATVLGLSAVDASVAARRVARVLSHELLARARAAAARGACRRETPVTLTLSDGTIMEGIVDLAFEEDGRWVVVDYKTDRELAGAEEQYRQQVAAYAAAVAATTGLPVSGVLVRT